MDEFIQGFWNFAQHYWWLIFPIMGMAGGAAKAWERSSKRRHERRLETLRMKAQLKTAEIEARALTQQARRRGPSVVDTTASVAPNDLVARLFSEHDEITARWLDYELDVAKLIAFPAMSDGRQPLTAAFLRAKKTADALRPASADARVSSSRSPSICKPSATTRSRSRSPRRTPDACAIRPSPNRSASASTARSSC